jgi:hypothetical protein
MAKKSDAVGGLPIQPERVPVGKLDLDARNPRLIEYGLGRNASQDKILEYLWQRMAVDEVAMSIAASGYWQHEPLIVAKEDGRDVVIEGNRRLAAVRLLLDGNLRRKLRATDLPPLSHEWKQKIRAEGLPVSRINKREDMWRYLGFKHVNGPARWGSFAKAQYIAFVHRKTGELLATIAAQIGDKHRTVQRLYRALMVIEQAERAGVWNRQFCYGSQLAFSHLVTALDYDGFRQFLHLKDRTEESPEPVDPRRMKELGEVCLWLWGDSRNDTPPEVKTQNPYLRRLDRILSDSTHEAIHALRRGEGIDTAYEISKGDDIVFSEALSDAKSALTKAQGRVSTGFRGEKHLLDLADTIADMADDLADTMHKKTIPIRRQRRQSHAHVEVEE